MTDRRPFNIRLSPTVVKQVDHYAVDRDLFRNEAVEELIKKALASFGDEGKTRSLYGVNQPI